MHQIVVFWDTTVEKKNLLQDHAPATFTPLHWMSLKYLQIKEHKRGHSLSSWIGHVTRHLVFFFPAGEKRKQKKCEESF